MISETVTIRILVETSAFVKALETVIAVIGVPEEPKEADNADKT